MRRTTARRAVKTTSGLEPDDPAEAVRPRASDHAIGKALWQIQLRSAAVCRLDDLTRVVTKSLSQLLSADLQDLQCLFRAMKLSFHQDPLSLSDSLLGQQDLVQLLSEPGVPRMGLGVRIDLEGESQQALEPFLDGPG